MSTPVTAEFPCCGPATAEGLAAVQGKVADARADNLLGQANLRGDLLTADAATRGSLLSAGSANTQNILSDANVNATTLLSKTCADTAAIIGTVDRASYAGIQETGKFGLANLEGSRNVGDKVYASGAAVQSQIDKFGLAGINTTRSEADRVGSAVDRASYGLAQDIQDTKDKVTEQATNIAWAQEGNEGRRFGETRAQIERINEAQSAYTDRAFKYSQQQNADNFARLSEQNENGFYRTGVAVAAADKQVTQSEISLGKALGAGFTDVSATLRDSYARLSDQNCDLKSAIAAAQAAAAECCCEVKEEVLRTGKELGLQAAQNFGAIQVEASKNTASIQLQAAVNAKESLLEQSKWFALAEKTAMVNKCDLEAKLAACCCEIKEVVSGTAQATQQLIQGNETSRVRDALAAANTESVYLRLKAEQSHHHHTPPYPYPYPYPFPHPHPHGGRGEGGR
jgi:hypothetical protein